jgi:ketosteroid isomerase-like protein
VTATPREVFDRLLRATVANSADELADLYAEDVVIELPFGQTGRPVRFVGREPLRQRFHAAAQLRRFTGVDSVVVYDGADPEVVIGEWRVHGEVLPTGRTYSLRFLMIVRVRDGLIVSSRDYGDSIAFATAFDRLPELLAAVSPS